MDKKISKSFLIFSLILFFFLAFSSFSLAQDRELEVDYPEIFGFKPETVKTLLPEYAKYIFNFSLAIFGIVVFGVLLLGGFRYITSTGDVNKLTDAKNQIASAFLGIIILLLSYIILTTINPQLVMFEIPYLSQVVVSRCTTEADCDDAGKYPDCQPSGTCECRFGACVKKVGPPVMTLIAVEIPLGQMMENGVWGKKRTDKVNTLLSDFEKFLNEEITVDSEKFTRISDLNRYVKRLTEDCRCDNSKAVCGKPEYGGGELDCREDPCGEARDKIKKAFEVNSEKAKKLKEFRERFSAEMKSLDEDATKLIALQKNVETCIAEKGEILNLQQFLAAADFYESRGIKVVTLQKFIPSKGDPLTFYCAIGGTMLDFPLDFGAAEIALELAEEKGGEIEEEMSCPAELPLGEVLDEIRGLTYETSVTLEDLTFYIDTQIENIRSLSNNVSQCKRENCEAKCGDIPNPCYDCCKGFVCRFCARFCSSPDLQVPGGPCVGKNPDAPYHSSPCPRDDIDEGFKKINLYESEILSLVKDVKEIFSDVSFVLKNSENPINLEVVRETTAACFSEDVEDPTWTMLYGEDVIGYPGPGGETIADYYPLNFFCCTSSREALARVPFPSAVRKPRPSVHIPPAGEMITPSAYGYNDVPYFAQGDSRWAAHQGCPSTLKRNGCFITSITMVLNYYGENISPPTLADWINKQPGLCTLSGLANTETIAKNYGLKHKRLYTAKDIIKSLKANPEMPVIAGGRAKPPYYSKQHWVVITGADKNFVYVNDPARPRKVPRPYLIDDFLKVPLTKSGARLFFK